MTTLHVRIVSLYALFAGLATAVNLGVQALTLSTFRGDFSVVLSIALGTLAGLPVKYVLDKKFIFRFKAKSLTHDSRLFAKYATLAGATTALFWGTEWVFYMIFASETLTLLGAAIGLAAGYVAKYQLDKRFVFVPDSKVEAHVGGN